MNKNYLKVSAIGASVAAGLVSSLAFAAGETSLFVIPTSTAPSALATVSATIADPGFLLILVVAIALPLAFWAAHGIKGLFTRGKKTS